MEESPTIDTLRPEPSVITGGHDGRHDAIVLSADGRHCARIAHGVARLDDHVLTANAVAMAALDAATWLVTRDGDEHALWRFDARGKRVGVVLPLGALGDDVRISAPRRGARFALIEGARVIELREHAGAIAVRELGAAGPDRPVLLAGRGVFRRQGPALVPCSGTLCRYPIAPDLVSATVASGSVVLDGAAAAIELEQRGVRHVVIHDARYGHFRTRIRIGAATVMAVAERRGLLVIGRECHLALLDVRTGRCHHERVLPAAIAGVAVSEDAERFAVLDVCGGILELRAGLAVPRDCASERLANVQAASTRIIPADPASEAAKAVEPAENELDAEQDFGRDAGACVENTGAADRDVVSRQEVDSSGTPHADADSGIPDVGCGFATPHANAGGGIPGAGCGSSTPHAEADAGLPDAGCGSGIPHANESGSVPDVGGGCGVSHAGTGSDAPHAGAAVRSPIALAALEPRVVPVGISSADQRALLGDLFELVASWCGSAMLSARGASDALAAARERESAAAERIRSWDRAPTPLTELAAEFELSPLARAILLITAAPHLWGELARDYRALAADTGRALVDELLVCQLLEIDRGERAHVAHELDDDAPLVRHGLIAVGRGARPFAALEVAHPIIRRLAGERFLAADANGPVAARSADRTLDELHGPRARVAALVAELARPTTERPVRVVVRGRTGCGRRTLAATLAGTAGRLLGLVELAQAPGAESVAALRRDLREAHLRGWLACVSGVDHVAAADASHREQVRAVLDGHPGPLFVRCEPGAVAPLAAEHLSVEISALTLSERRAAWLDAFVRHRLAPEGAAGLAERYHVGAGTANRAVAEIAATGVAASAPALIDRVLRQRRAERLGSLATQVEHLASWDDLVLPDDMLDSVRELVARVRLRSTVLDGWGMRRIASTGRAVTALFQGGPGTGKTLVAGVVARELGYDLYRVDLSRVTSKWIGETEKNLAALFDAAEDGQCILLFDEADSLFGKRTEVKSSHDRHANLEVNYLLQRLDSFEGIAILTTNFGAAIDPAFRRRLTLHLQFPFPEETERERLWRAHLPASLPIAGDLELATLARKYPLSGGYIRNAALRAVYLAAGERASVSADHLRRAVAAEYRDKSKITTSGILE